MKTNKITERYYNTDDYVFVSKIAELIEYVKSGRGFRFSNFLDLHQRSIVSEIINYEKFNSVSFFGGYDNAERVIALFSSEEYSGDKTRFPISVLKISYYKEDKPGHRDILGALIALGIKRETIGDIVKTSDSYIVFVREQLRDYIIQNFTKAGRYIIKCSEISDFNPDEIIAEYKEIKDTVSSNRADCVISSICGISRSESSHLIKSGLVFVNSANIYDVTYNIKDGDIISVRGYGKYKIDSFGSLSRKNRIFINAKKYI